MLMIRKTRLWLICSFRLSMMLIVEGKQFVCGKGRKKKKNRACARWSLCVSLSHKTSRGNFRVAHMTRTHDKSTTVVSHTQHIYTPSIITRCLAWKNVLWWKYVVIKNMTSEGADINTTLFLAEPASPDLWDAAFLTNQYQPQHSLCFSFMFRIIVAADDTPVSRKAISYGLRLHESIPQSSIQFVFAVGLNPTSNTSINLLYVRNTNIRNDQHSSTWLPFIEVL